jgi:hypothetical protein
LGAVANNLATLSLIFSRLINGSDSEDSLICSVSVVFRLFTDRYFPFLLLRILSSVSSKFSTYRKIPYRCVQRPETTDTENSSDSSESTPPAVVQGGNINERVANNLATLSFIFPP